MNRIILSAAVAAGFAGFACLTLPAAAAPSSPMGIAQPDGQVQQATRMGRYRLMRRRMIRQRMMRHRARRSDTVIGRLVTPV